MKQFDPTTEQLAVINHRGSHALVFAGPGTGKTETLARRFASLVVDDRIHPSAILVLTFSRRAAEQMLERVVLRLRQRTGRELAVSELFVKTFHSFCARLLDGDGPRIYERNLLTPIKERLLWKGVAQRTELRSFQQDVRTSPAFATDALNLIAQLKGQDVAAEAMRNAAGSDARLRDIAALYSALDADRKRLGLSDFRDLVKDALVALADPESPASRWLRERGGFVHILVDEFQDSDRLQLRLLEVLAGPEPARAHPVPEICFVGDFNQSIYRFRGATPDNIEKARSTFACTPLTLQTNRRSAQAILDVANKTPGLDPKSKTDAENPELEGSVRLVVAPRPDAEIAYICDAVAEHLAAGTPAREIAVLLRASEPYTSLVVAQLDARGIPVAARPTAGFLDDPAVSAVLIALRLCADVENWELWTRLLSNPLIGFSRLSVRLAFDAGRRAYVTNPFVALTANPPAGVRPFEDFLRSWRRVERESERADVASLVASIVREFDLLRPVREAQQPHRDGLVPGWDPRSSPSRIGALVEAARDLQTTSRALGSGSVHYGRFVDDIEEIAGLLADPSEGPAPESDGVRVMSIHAAKGLEFDVVIVPQVIDGVLPQHERGHALLSGASRQAIARLAPAIFARENDAYQEECSLWYVAMTRARRAVVVTAAAADDDDIELPVSPFTRPIENRSEARPSGRPHEARDGAREAEPQPRSLIVYTVDHLSPSSVERFITCPRRFFYKDVLRLEVERDEETTLLGTILHRALAEFHANERVFSPAIELPGAAHRWGRLLLGLIDRIAPEAAAQADLRPDSSFTSYQKALAHRFATNYAQWLEAESLRSPFEVLACEQRLESVVDGIPFIGRADRVDRLVDGGLVIRDYKSGKAKPGSLRALRTALERLDRGEQVAGDAPDGLTLQLLTYVPGAEALFNDRVARVEYVYARDKDGAHAITTDAVAIVDNGDASNPSALTRAELARILDEIAAAPARALAAGDYQAFWTARDVQTCRFCDFVRTCPGAMAVEP